MKSPDEYAIASCPKLLYATHESNARCYHGGECIDSPVDDSTYCVCQRGWGGSTCSQKLELTNGTSVGQNSQINIKY